MFDLSFSKNKFTKFFVVGALVVLAFLGGRFSRPSETKDRKVQLKEVKKTQALHTRVRREKVTLPSGEVREVEDTETKSEEHAEVKELKEHEKVVKNQSAKNFVFGGVSQKGTYGVGYSRQLVGPLELGVFVSRSREELLTTGFVGLRF